MTSFEKQEIKQQLVRCLADAKEVRRIIVFGSFLHSEDPHDIDVAVFQDTDKKYLELAMRYRRLLRPVAARIPLDVIPIRPDPGRGPFMREIEQGEVLYER